MDKLISILSLSKHAILRMAQRNISLDDLQYVLEHGERVYRTGIAIFILRKRDIPQKDRKKAKITRLEGTIVLTDFSQDGNVEIITLYRNREAFRTLLCKEKYDKRKKYRMNRNLPWRG